MATSKLEDDTMSCQSAAVDTMVLFLACVVLKTFPSLSLASSDLLPTGARFRRSGFNHTRRHDSHSDHKQQPPMDGAYSKKADLARIACHSSLESVRDPLSVGSNREESGILFVPALATR